MTMRSESRPRTAAEALATLRAGNARFTQGVRCVDALASSARVGELAAGQSPFAVILCCSDSRVPAEIVFDCGLGDLFVVRVAGNICAPSLVGSVEFAVAKFGTELVVVMGHTRCGAVTAAIDAMKNGASAISANLHDIVERINPAIRELSNLEGDALMHAAVRANVRHSADHLRHGSRILEERIAEGKVSVVGAEYALETGSVDFFDLPKGLGA